LSVAGILKSFDTFIKIYAFTYILTALILLIYLIVKGRLYFHFTPSRVTRKFFRKIVTQAGLVWGGSLVYNLSTYFAQFVIAAVVPGGLAFVAVYNLAYNIASLMQAPQRVIIAAAIGPLSQAWKDKDYGKLNRIYHRSSINQLIFSVGMFILIWMNFTDGVLTFHLKNNYLDARYVFLFIGLMRIVDMGTGLNSQMIATSTFWRFDFYTGITLVVLTLPLNYVLAKKLGVAGPAIADLATFTIYNAIRCIFLYVKFGMQPFTFKSLYTVLLGLAGYGVCHFLLASYHGFQGLFLRSIVFIAVFGGGVIGLQLSEDVLPVWRTMKKKVGLGR
jgi:O-antigen/teichoic acid export membrane protein